MLGGERSGVEMVHNDLEVKIRTGRRAGPMAPGGFKTGVRIMID